MDLQRLEAKCHALVDRVLAGNRIEDDLVECKAEWPDDPHRAARRIAAHANTARGESILWLIGLDEDNHRVSPLGATDLANWWPAVEKRFADGVAPSYQQLQIHTEHGTVVALQFNTKRSPYLVTAEKGGSAIDREVPWRQGTRTRTAKRSELLSLLVEASVVPDAQLLDVDMTATIEKFPKVKGDGDVRVTRAMQFEFTARVFLDTERPTMMPSHLSKLAFRFADGAELSAVPTFRPYGPELAAAERTSLGGLAVLSSGVRVHGPDLLQVSAQVFLGPDWEQRLRNAPEVHFELRMPVNRTNRSLTVRDTAHWVSGESKQEWETDTWQVGRWEWRASHDEPFPPPTAM